MKLSKRLLAVAGMVTPGSILADIGTDHAYIPIYLVENRIIPHAIAMDVNRGPLARAREHIREHGLEDDIETRLSDGLSGLHAGEAQSLVIAGMGGALTVRILREGAQVLFPDAAETPSAPSFPDAAETSSVPLFPDAVETPSVPLFSGTAETLSAQCLADTIQEPELILQPQSEISLVRGYLEQNGFHIVREDMVFEDGKYYPMMKAVRACDPEASSCCSDSMELNFGPELLKMRHPVLRQFLLRERATQERILQSLGQNSRRMSEVLSYIRLIDEALMLYSG